MFPGVISGAAVTVIKTLLGLVVVPWVVKHRLDFPKLVQVLVVVAVAAVAVVVLVAPCFLINQ